MRVALEEAALAAAEGNMGCGAIITQEGKVVSRAHNQATTLADVTAHAETQAVRRLSVDWRGGDPTLPPDAGPLEGATLFTHVETCPLWAWGPCITRGSGLVPRARSAP